MSKRIGIITLILILFTAANAQEKLNYSSADKQSLELFQNKKWTELIQFSAKVRKSGMDFFYLQVRTGIALYNQKKYRIAS
jgi:hypothetical protein